MLAPPRKLAPPPVFIPEPPPAEPSQRSADARRGLAEEDRLAHRRAGARDGGHVDAQSRGAGGRDRRRGALDAERSLGHAAPGHRARGDERHDPRRLRGGRGRARAGHAGGVPAGRDRREAVRHDGLPDRLARLHHEEAPRRRGHDRLDDRRQGHARAPQEGEAPPGLGEESCAAKASTSSTCSRRTRRRSTSPTSRRWTTHNKAVLNRLGRLLDKGSRAQLRAFRNETRKEYRALKETQLTSWAQLSERAHRRARPDARRALRHGPPDR